MMGWTEATGKPLLNVALAHPKVRLIANALGTPPADVIKQVHEKGALRRTRRFGEARQAPCGRRASTSSSARARKGEVTQVRSGASCSGPRSSTRSRPTPVLAAGGVGTGRQIAAALAMGAQGVWGGTLWLTVEEADTAPGQIKSYLAASSSDTVRSRSYTGKPCRMLKNDWTEAWDRDDTPDPLPMPMQMLVAIEAVGAARRYPEQSKESPSTLAARSSGERPRSEKAQDVVLELVEEYVEAVDRLTESGEGLRRPFEFSWRP